MAIRMISLPEQPINLGRGWPSPRLLPLQALHSAAEAVLSQSGRATESMLYGPAMGDPALRVCIAEWLSRLYHLRSPPAKIHPPHQLADHHTGPMANPISPDRISITNGASGNLATILSAFTDPLYTRRIWMVEPTYYLACTIFEDAGFQGRLVGIPEDENGVNLDYLRSKLTQVDREAEELLAEPPSRFKKTPQYGKLYRHVIYVVPTFSNPSGKTYSVANREGLVRLARDFDALIVTDDCYDFLSWKADSHPGMSETKHDSDIISTNEKRPISAAPPPPRLVDIDASFPGGDREWGNAVSSGSFSKVIGPGMRCGWAEATPTFIRRLNAVGALISGGAPSQFASILIEHVLRTGALEHHLATNVIPVYQLRYSAIKSAISNELVPLGVKIDTGAPWVIPGNGNQRAERVIGGFFLCIIFPEGVPADDVAVIASRDYNLRILPASMMAVRGSPKSENEEGVLTRGARLCWAWEEEEMLVEGVRRIALILKDRFLLTQIPK
ncbi:hypothetical protein N7449_012187 [Penicillium cf. viridicatum]|uniref:Aminotransferase class I/classII large domain-containing protein n=1 Tax=Penicillium cf. viridicatum TaxID=2972119 RepID=A0A9W9IS10_9EURO|nr:hypothetical protein N7449_012187 [Penicillium cf. viridicatum]